ncbi:MAG TPA: peptidylprolyl isomerase [Nitrososphaera sp.]|nr:peptidylprolyl isomerase [Nitrososphaera sp.]
MLEGTRPLFRAGSFEFQTRHLLVIAVLALAFTSALIMRFYPVKYGFYLNEFDPYFDYRATKYIVDNGLDAYWQWHDTMSWYPEGRPIPETSQSGLHITTAFLYSIFGSGSDLLDFTIVFPAVIGSLTVVALFALVRVLGNTTAGLFSALLLAFSPSIIQRGNLGWFKSEPLGLFFGIIAAYLFISAIKHNEIKFAIPKAVVGGLILGLANASWGGIQYFSIPIAIFFVALPFFRRDLTIPMYVAIAFTVFTMISAGAFPRPGIEFVLGLPGLAMMGAAIFLIIANFLKKFGGPQKQLRNTSFLLIAFVVGAIGIVAGGAYISPTFRYINAINPFIGAENPLVESVAEHFTPTVADYFVDFSVLLMFAGLGAWLAFKRRDDVSIFALILGITGVYVSATFARLLVFASIGIIVLSALGLYEVTRSMMAYREATATPSTAHKPMAATREERRKIEFANRAHSTSGKGVKIAYVVVTIMMLSLPMFYPFNSNWLSSADIPAAIANGGTGYRMQTDDWVDAMEWIEQNTEEDAVIASWWDYGYWITTLGNRTTLADNATLNSTRIATLAKMFISDEQSGLKIAQDLQADYILVYVVGQVRFLGDANTTDGTTERVPLYSLGQGGDESKKQWFMRIGGFDETRYIERDGFTPKPEFWNNTLLGKLFPFEPASYIAFGAGGTIQNVRNVTQGWTDGFTGIYMQSVKYPADGGDDQPLHLVYASPSFENKENILFGVFIYKVNHDYVPTPEGDPYAAPEPSRPTADMTPSNEIAIINTTQGMIEIEFFPNAAPNHVENFIELASEGFYNGTLFHRIVPGFVIQGGDPNTKGDDSDRNTWGQGGPGYTLAEEFNDIPHERGIVSMARSADPNSAGSQFFIVLDENEATRALDGRYTVFGRVINGMDVVDEIASLQTVGGTGPNREQPVDIEQARILSIEIVER